MAKRRGRGLQEVLPSQGPRMAQGPRGPGADHGPELNSLCGMLWRLWRLMSSDVFLSRFVQIHSVFHIAKAIMMETGYAVQSCFAKTMLDAHCLRSWRRQDILFFWVARMVMMGLTLTDKAQYDTVLYAQHKMLQKDFRYKQILNYRSRMISIQKQFLN